MENRIALMGLTRRTSDGLDICVVEEQYGLQAGFVGRPALEGLIGNKYSRDLCFLSR
jgi:hypothetical protein